MARKKKKEELDPMELDAESASASDPIIVDEQGVEKSDWRRQRKCQPLLLILGESKKNGAMNKPILRTAEEIRCAIIRPVYMPVYPAFLAGGQAVAYERVEGTQKVKGVEVNWRYDRKEVLR